MSLIAAFTTFAASAANTWYVDGEKSTSGTGNSWASAFNSLQEALTNQALLAEDVIWVKGNSTGITYKPGTVRSSTFTLKSGVKIYGGFAGTESETQFALRDPVANRTILSGDIGTADDQSDNCYHVVTATGALEFPSTVLDGFTIKRGNTIPDGRNDPPANYSGAGILVSGDGQTCEPIIARCVFVENEADANGGGAAVAGSSSHPWFVNCEFRDNQATSSGGGLAVGGATATMMNCVVHHNTAGTSGGGAFVSGFNATIFVLSSTFAENEAGSTGGLAKPVNNGFADATNSIFWGNTDSNPTAHDQVSSITANYCCIQDLPTGLGDNNIGADPVDDNPLFLNAAAGDFRLALASPCIDIGLTAGLPPDVANIDADGGVDALSEATPLDFGLARRLSYTLAGTIDECSPDVLDMGAYENGDCDGDGTRDEDEVDIGGSASGADGIPDDCQDCNGNSVLDPEELTGNDCNHNGRLDECDIALGCSHDFNSNGIPDECECGLDIVFVVDDSGSTDPKLGAICEMIDSIEGSLPSSPLVTVRRIAIVNTAGNFCSEEDVFDVTGEDDESSNTCPGPFSPEDWVNAVEVVAEFYPWAAGKTRVIVPIGDEGLCFGPTCDPSAAPLVKAIERAIDSNCTVYPIAAVGYEACTATSASALASATGGIAWFAEVVDDYNEGGGIGAELADALESLLVQCLLPCDADLNGDGDVGAPDLALLLGAWGSCASCPEDLDGNGDVGASDLAILLGAWGPCATELPGSNGFMAESSSQFNLLVGESAMTPDQLADLLVFADVGELATYLGSLDFGVMQNLLEAFLGG